jgi:cell division protein FtsB
MKSVVSIAFGLSVIATLVAAVYAAGTPDAIYDKQTKLVEQIASIVHDNQNDCDLMGDKLDRLVANNAALLREAQKLTPEQTKQVEEDYKARGNAARARMVDGLIKCHANAKVKAAIEDGRAWKSGAADGLDLPATDR